MAQKTNNKRTRSTQAYLEIAAIRNDAIVLANGGMRAILLVNSVNFALKAPQEQEDIILRYQGFINSLNFPIQICMQSRKLDLTDYLAKLLERQQNETNAKVKEQIVAYTSFMEKLVSVANIMDKRFYVVVPYDPINLRQRNLLDKLLHPAKQVTISMTEKEFEEYLTQLDERVSLMLGGLGGLGLKAGRLSTKEIIEMLYSTYNPEESVTERLVDIDNLTSRTIRPEIAAATHIQDQTGVKNG